MVLVYTHHINPRVRYAFNMLELEEDELKGIIDAIIEEKKEEEREYESIVLAWVFHNYEKVFTSFFLFNRFSQMVLFSFVFIRLFFVDYLVEHRFNFIFHKT
tara:strand:- start:107 stop:412 length:306 start_codon:yes stop_codon:yes gene_type:complete